MINKKGKVKETYNIGISRKGKIIIAISCLTLFIGFLLLSFTDQEAQNFASIVSPFVIILSYIFIGIGLVIE